MENHEKYISRCILLAAQGIGQVAPNPMVGCVIVCDDTIIGEGFHVYYGGPHAEVNAINSVANPELLKRSTLYVSLEPCAHFGKTPPCSDLIIRSGIPHVVIGCGDTYSEVNGKGIEKLRSAGIEVTAFVLEDECRHLNRRFFVYQEQKRPYVILKWAQSADGFIDKTRGEGETGVNWISGAETKSLVHLWRSEEAAIMTGRKTIENDNPLLTVREVSGKNPVRIVLDPDLRLPADRRVFNDEALTLVLNSTRDDMAGEHLRFIKCDLQSSSLLPLMDCLHRQQIQSVIVEGGAETLGRFISAGLWDEARVITGDIQFGSGLKAPEMHGRLADQFQSGTDRISIYHQ